ncbi:hypothetical protein GbCGDNIH3_7115 [Granulibacter bethesdensis]|uniref:Uncharacterized protein n=1 Tax=Granulibacter bethesdensis TaxID=364410 RepID=A0AAN0RDI9_9PROT|nr:hypothetical protein GbCGDNIH3_7115 [Granulibacter bethesdensis]AHJ66509.1 hypothetical protein GbCGDNIH4_7285 [Granulibacter bethesdensis CGDNIH4]
MRGIRPIVPFFILSSALSSGHGRRGKTISGIPCMACHRAAGERSENI